MAERAIRHVLFLIIHALFPLISRDNQQCTTYGWVSNFMNFNDRDFSLSWLVLKISMWLAKLLLNFRRYTLLSKAHACFMSSTEHLNTV